MTKAELMQKDEHLTGDISKLFELLFWSGMLIAQDHPHKHLEWDIECVIPVPKKNDETVYIVIGNRHTDFQPYVAWHWFGDSNYAWGHYCQTFDDAKEEAKYKLRNEIGMYREEM